jgi:hypothetical protein
MLLDWGNVQQVSNIPGSHIQKVQVQGSAQGSIERMAPPKVHAPWA